MEKRKSIIIVIVSTILFGMISKQLVGIPYMIWGQFDFYFVLSFVLWALYAASLYAAGKAGGGSRDKRIKTGFCCVGFGVLASCIKMGTDTVVLLLVGETSNQLLLTFAMETEILLFGTVMMLFLFYAVQKGKFVWRKSFGKYAGILGGTIGIYVVVFLFFHSKYQEVAPYTDIHALTEGGNINLNMMLEMEKAIQYSRNFTMFSTVVYVLFLISFWILLQKSIKKPCCQT